MLMFRKLDTRGICFEWKNGTCGDGRVVLNSLQGFTAELSASGSFCPRHVKLPIISCFYRLSDDDAPSPYMGYISLKDEPIGRRGYHVPKRGTIQLVCKFEVW
ncbi:hypothetical protein QZH41_000186 [Actinostola sp. cb2023]|nr:hypothetical protein QZH41_000186 [Actinostola sp. cb2023]